MSYQHLAYNRPFYVDELPLPESIYQKSARSSLMAPLACSASIISYLKFQKDEDMKKSEKQKTGKYPGDLGSGHYQLVQHGNYRARLEKQRPKARAQAGKLTAGLTSSVAWRDKRLETKARRRKQKVSGKALAVELTSWASMVRLDRASLSSTTSRGKATRTSCSCCRMRGGWVKIDPGYENKDT
jgi:hypothetical protein